MKTKLLFLLSLIFFSTVSYSQTYYFSKLVKKANVQTSTGNEQRTIGTTQGSFRIVFETPNDPQIKKLFTVLNPGQANGPGLPWFGLLKDMGFVEKDSKLLKKSLYHDTENDENVLVLIADDYSQIVIFKSDDTVWEYMK
ncbi:MAG: hypothetical protein Q8T08_18030 [Ignavibacteria bacterium]|nr:hypothetical protein [Ignavibacteria bacterium]